MAANADAIMNLDPELMKEVIYKAVWHKAQVVAIDEKERGLRSTLNFGHTIGHAFEALMSPSMLHGEFVSLGAVAEADLAYRMGHLPFEAIDKIRSCFEAYGLPVEIPPEWRDTLTLEALMTKMAVDKKNEGKTIRCTMITSVGSSMENPQPVERELMEAVMKDMLTGTRPKPP
eukprot:gnl/TRDRNA2_/TRDRNA2_161048_c0_seq1.p1 gnl/TRDRNA2_/TRDRNA2_161048_c0~~gnl/TRDRNA2_/TRDRNA2_161048_c0_seq1.p1  ORF type:complete len:174 (+),score=36.45 gnl/TRDRNA2_/TRDRNA2_161048_c0_seq1:291-812(+)